MTSWRASTSQQAQDDLDDLLSAVLPFATRSLEKYGEFFPFAATVATDGEVRLVGADPGDGEHPNSSDVLTLLREGITADRDSLRAAAYVADVLVEGSDTVLVQLEHREGTALEVLVPYARSRFRKTLKTGGLSVQAGERYAWAE